MPFKRVDKMLDFVMKNMSIGSMWKCRGSDEMLEIRHLLLDHFTRIPCTEQLCMPGTAAIRTLSHATPHQWWLKIEFTDLKDGI